MVDKATRARLKEKAAIAKAKKALTATDEELSKSIEKDKKANTVAVAGVKLGDLVGEVRSLKEPKTRRCCNSPKGNGPHEPWCPTLKEAIPALCPACSRDVKMKKKHRLPHGSKFEVMWDDEGGVWRGMLDVPATDSELGHIISDVSDGVFHLLSRLDDRYLFALEERIAMKKYQESFVKKEVDTAEGKG